MPHNKMSWAAISLALAMGFAVVFLMSLKFFLAEEPLPPLLKGVSAGGGWWGACSPHSIEALSPELSSRLALEFPPGISEELLIRALEKNGFRMASPCADDQSIHLALYRQNRFMGTVVAEVYWNVDAANRLVWTKGYYRFEGL